MEKQYLIMDIGDGQDSKYGKILMVKANPVITDSMGIKTVMETRGKHTEMFHFPLLDRHIDPLVQIAKEQQLWSPKQEDYIDERLREENTNQVITVHRHIDLLYAMCCSDAAMIYHVKEVTFNNSDFSEVLETWIFSEHGIYTPHGYISFKSFMEVNQNGMNGVEFSVKGVLNFNVNKYVECPFGEINLSAVAVMRQTGNVWLWIYLIDEIGETVAALCGYENLFHMDSFSKFVSKLKCIYQSKQL